MKKGLKRAILASAVGLAAALTPSAVKYGARNVMSHNPQMYNRSQIINSLPSLILEKGEYKGIIINKVPCGIPRDTDLNEVHLGLQPNPFKESSKKPTSLTGSETIKFYDPGCALKWNLPELLFGNLTFSEWKQVLEMKQGDAIKINRDTREGRGYYSVGVDSDIDFGHVTYSIGKDTEGHYLSFYDSWDFEGNSGYFKKFDGTLEKIATKILPKIGEPIHFYKRFYFKDYGINESAIEKLSRGEVPHDISSILVDTTGYSK